MATLVAVLLLLLITGLLAWRTWRAAEHLTAIRVVAAPAPPTGTPVGSSDVRRPSPPPPVSSSPTPDLGDPRARVGRGEPVSLGREAAKEYRRMAEYPPWSRPVTDESDDPILRDRHVSPITAAGPGGEEPLLVVFPGQASVEVPDPVLLYAYLTVDGSRVPARAIAAVILSDALQPLTSLTYRDDGSEGDGIAGDGIYTARFAPPEEFAPALSESFLVRVTATTLDGDERIAATSFLYSNPHARLTGRYRDHLTDGNLVIEAEVEIRRPGRFHLQATLYDRDGARPIGEAHVARELAEGTTWMPLTFFGRILAQRGIEGPYLIRFIALSTTTRMPNAKNRVVENAHLTAPYRPDQFSDAPFDGRALLDTAERLEADLHR